MHWLARWTIRRSAEGLVEQVGGGLLLAAGAFVLTFLSSQPLPVVVATTVGGFGLGLIVLGEWLRRVGLASGVETARLTARFKGETRDEYDGSVGSRSLRLEVENEGPATAHDARLSLRVSGCHETFDGWRWSSNLPSISLPPGAREAFTLVEAHEALGWKWYLQPFDFVRNGPEIQPTTNERLAVHVSVSWTDGASQRRSAITECFSFRLPDARSLDQSAEALKVVCAE